MTDLSPLRFAVDTVECTFSGELPLSIRGDLENDKSKAKEFDVPVPMMLAGMEFFVQPKGLGYYPYRVENALVALRVSALSKGPMVSARLSALALASLGHQAVYDLAEAAAAELGATIPHSLQRIDLARDFQGWHPTHDEMEHVCRRSRYIGHHREGRGETFQFGKRDLVVRLYNKTAQIQVKSEYAWMHDVLRDCPGFEDSEEVWRLEVQLRGDILRELSCRSVETAFANLPALFDFVLHEVELRVPGKDTTITRWPADPRWVALRQVDGIAAPVTRSRRVPRMLSQKEAARRALSALTTFAAYEPPDLTITEAQAKLAGVICDLVDESDDDYSGLVETKRCRLSVSTFTEEVPF